MSSEKLGINIDDIIHFVLFYKKIIRRFLKYFREKYFKIKRFKENFTIEKDFHILQFERKKRQKYSEFEIKPKKKTFICVLKRAKTLRQGLMPVKIKTPFSLNF